MWRNGAVLYAENWNDRRAPFDQIILSRFVGDEAATVTYQGRVIHGVVGTVITREISSLHSLNMNWRGRGARVFKSRARLQARLEIIHLLAGPVVERHYLARQGRYEPGYYWREEHDANIVEGIDGDDLSKALGLAKALYLAPHRQARCLDNAVAAIEAQLNDDPRYWGAIEALADALLARKTCRLSHNPAVQAMRRGWAQNCGTPDEIAWMAASP
jgi:hypothetical protein